MMIHSKLKDYEVVIEDKLEFLSDFETENVQFVIDKNVYCLYEQYFKNIPDGRLILLEATEGNKVIETALGICEDMTEISAKRNIHLISIGGGIVQDITGFVANILYRGIRWTFIPTTLLAACDSCIGGKTSLNYHKFKNLLGTFYPPDKIHICTKFFNTLSERDYKSGLGEVVKFNIMAGADGLDNIEKGIESLLRKEDTAVQHFVCSSLSYKKTFIEIDEFDRGERIKLNFAHTFGHAVEVVSNYEIPHGTAVAIGMIMADRLSVKRGLLNEDAVKRSEEVLMKIIDIDSELLNVDISDIIKAIRKDKKQTNDAMTAVLRTESDLEIIKDMTDEEVSYAVRYFKELYKTKNNMS